MFRIGGDLFKNELPAFSKCVLPDIFKRQSVEGKLKPQHTEDDFNLKESTLIIFLKLLQQREVSYEY